MTDSLWMKNGAGPMPKDAVVGWLIGPVFLLIAIWFMFGVEPDPVPEMQRVKVDAAQFSNAPLRTPIGDPPTIQVAGFTKKCQECHDLFRSNPKQALLLNQHSHLRQAHGMNDRCLNCHDAVDRSRLVLPGGETVSFAETPRLCATCHGLLYRDWERGMHGRTTGSWDPAKGRRRLTCNECHDPHAPAFAPMLALPGPNTLRMGELDHDAQARPKQRNPLREWSGNKGDH